MFTRNLWGVEQMLLKVVREEVTKIKHISAFLNIFQLFVHKKLICRKLMLQFRGLLLDNDGVYQECMV